MNTKSPVAAVADLLAAQLGAERVLLPGPAYDDALPIWNGAVTSRPALLVRCRWVSDVQAVVRAAREHGLPLSVRGGGHDWAGRALRDGGVVVDLSEMRSVEVDAAARIATVGGGAVGADVTAAVEPHGLLAATGTVGAVGLTGLTLGGGYGPLMANVGLALDNLIGADVVLADGRLVSTDANNEPDLFWALRGGGGNFGVVTSLRIKLHPISQVIAGLIFFPWSQTEDIWDGYVDLIAEAPDDLTVQTGVLTGPDGNPTLYMAPVWSGQDLAYGQKWIDRFQQLGTPLMAQVAPMPYSALLGLFDAQIANGRHYEIKTRPLGHLTTGAVAALIKAGEAKTSPTSGIVLHHFRGAGTRVPLGETAFGLRREHFTVEIVAAWEPDEDAELHRGWAAETSADLEPFALPGGYPNLLGPDETAQIAEAYGENAERLLAVKKQFDSDGVFTATPLPPQ
ncbi:FAD-binding oxidoreductase [Kribbella sp. NPDC058693]|uniref:FAD-binding oxidoreductase n=1 Tax=Kribbella sp. NPDC058693 TaxID=3346602 RepID=UPI003665049F